MVFVLVFVLIPVLVLWLEMLSSWPWRGISGGRLRRCGVLGGRQVGVVAGGGGWVLEGALLEISRGW